MYDNSAVDEAFCDQYYQYETVSEWDSCGNAYDAQGDFLFYDNFHYDYQLCNNDYSSCYDFGYEEGDKDADPLYMEIDFCDECGSCYDYYGNYVQYSPSAVDEYWCSQYYQYDKVDSWDKCGNAYDAQGNYLFYDNEHYDYKACNEGPQDLVER